MESKAVVHTNQGNVIEAVIAKGDLSQLTPTERVMYYKATCDSLGLNPLTKPFEYITLNGKLTLYARKDATDQLRKLHGISITKLEREAANGAYVVTATATDRDGRTDSSIGAVYIDGLKGDAACNAMMKAESKAKRRVTLSLVGLGMSDETEIESIPNAQRVAVDTETGEIEQPKPEPHWTAVEGAQANFEAYLAKRNINPAYFYDFADCDFAGLPDKRDTMALVRDYVDAAQVTEPVAAAEA